MLPEEIMLEKKVWAVVGVSPDPEKYANRIFLRLKAKNYEVYPVNPMYEEVEGEVCYPNLASLPQKPAVINMVVSPKRGIAYIEEAARLGVSNLWLQPGTYDDALIQKMEELGLHYVKACVLVACRL
jgi:uncharacterized protein